MCICTWARGVHAIQGGHVMVAEGVPQGCISPAVVLQGRRLLVLVLLGCHLPLLVLGLQVVGPRNHAAKCLCRASISSCWC